MAASTTPRMGDGSAAGHIHDMARRNNNDTLGVNNLWRGTNDIKCLRIFDLGYTRDTRRAADRRATVMEFSEEVTRTTVFLALSSTPHPQEDVTVIFPFKAGTKFFGYDGATHTLTLNHDPNTPTFHLASWANAAKITTFLRPGVEQFHGALFLTYKVNSSCTAVTVTFAIFDNLYSFLQT